jgi:hypothetical protein
VWVLGFSSPVRGTNTRFLIFEVRGPYEAFRFLYDPSFAEQNDEVGLA